MELWRKNINEFNQWLFGLKKEDGTEATGIQKKIEETQKEQTERFQALINEHQTTYEDLEKKIKSALPGAVAAGLAKSYSDAKKEHQKNGWMFAGFIASLIGLIIIYIGSFRQYIWGDIALSEVALSVLLIRITFGFPLVWLAWFLQKEISDKSRLREEYHHKQRVMSMYDGIRKYIVEFPAKGQLFDLTKIVLDTVSRNPSTKMGESKTILEYFQDKIKSTVKEMIRNNDSAQKPNDEAQKK